MARLSPATRWLVVCDDGGVVRREGWVLIDADDIAATTGLAAVTATWVIAIGFVHLSPCHGSSAPTFPIVLETFINVSQFPQKKAG
jgi:hypothetical protein